jgi:hypothetical protein
MENLFENWKCSVSDEAEKASVKTNKSKNNGN